jgi:hypothetical protein
MAGRERGTRLDPPCGMSIDPDVRTLIEEADHACRTGDMATLSWAVRALVPRMPRGLQYDAVAVAELAALDGPIACDRWRSMLRRVVDAFVTGVAPGAPSAA